MYNPYNLHMRDPEPELSGEGLLRINVFDNAEGKPLESAEVKITPRGNRANVIFDEFTNESGQTRNG